MTRNNRRDLSSEADSQPFMKDQTLFTVCENSHLFKREVVNFYVSGVFATHL